ncbi:MAG: hypothetical protein NVS2B2_10460 [Ktedonobacteraceae bacterium]
MEEARYGATCSGPFRAPAHAWNLPYSNRLVPLVVTARTLVNRIFILNQHLGTVATLMLGSARIRVICNGKKVDKWTAYAQHGT